MGDTTKKMTTNDRCGCCGRMFKKNETGYKHGAGFNIKIKYYCPDCEMKIRKQLENLYKITEGVIHGN